MITHNAAIAAMADRVIHISDGHITAVERNEPQGRAGGAALVMRAIDRKLLRDFWSLRGQALAIAMVSPVASLPGSSASALSIRWN